MPMNTSIPLQQTETPDLLDTLGKAYNLRRQRQIQDDDMRQKNQAFLDDLAVRRAMAPEIGLDGSSQPRAPLDQVTRLTQLGTPGALKTAADLQDMYFNRQRQEALLANEQQDLQAKKLEHVARLAVAAHKAGPGMSQLAWTPFVRAARDAGFDPDNHLSDVYSDEAAEYYGNLGMSALQQMDQQRQQDQDREAALRNQQLQQNQADRQAEMQRYHDQIVATRRGSRRAPVSPSLAPQPGTSLGDYIPTRRWQ